MSRIDELIQEYCPDGVEYKRIDEIFNVNNGYTPSKNNLEYWENGDIPWFRMEDIRENGKVLNDSIQKINQKGVRKLFPKDSLMLATTATIGVHALITVDFVCNQQLTCCAIKDSFKDNMNIKFYFYYFDLIDKECIKIANQGGGMAIVSLSKLKELLVPVPPLNVQEEIVRVLDEYTDVTNSLVNELTAELEARKKQYEYYRNNVFDSITNYGVYKLEELCDVITKQTGFDYSSTIKPSLLTEKIEGTYSFIQNKDFSGTNISFNTDYYIPINIANSFPKILIDRPSILISISGKIGNIGFYDFQEKAFIGGAIAICKLKKEVSGKYIMYYLMSGHGQRYLFKSVKAASHLNITVESIRKTKILLPPLDEQQAIVDILDRFDALCNDITTGLPAEIEARQKQYEYYRDKLLTFKPKN